MTSAITTAVATPAITTPATSQSAAASTALTGDMSTFLKMLTTQLQNQDPTSPMDTNQMTTQLVQFSQVEQQINANSNLEKLVTLSRTSALTASAPLIGQTVQVESDHLSLQNGVATLLLPVAGAVTTAQVTISDGSGRTLRQEAVTLGSGQTRWAWDGRDSTGTRQTDGAYRVAVTGAGAGGTAAALPFTVVGTATGSEQSGTGVTLDLGALSVGFDKLRRVGAATP